MILESIVTTVAPDGSVNLAPMGPRVEPHVPTTSDPLAGEPSSPRFTLRPFKSSQTYQNLCHAGTAVIHVTDDVELFAKAAVNALDRPADTISRVHRLDETDWWVLNDCHRWFAVTINDTVDHGPKVEMTCRVERSGTVRPFFGFNRAKHAVIEAAILATRTKYLAADLIREELTRLTPLVEKTAGPVERSSFEFLCETIDARLEE